MTESTSARPSRRGGRSGRRHRRNAHAEGGSAGTLGTPRKIPLYGLLDEDSLLAIEQQADWILHNVGIEFRGDDVALDLFRDSGATVSSERVRFEPGHARELSSTAPARFTLHARDPVHSIEVGGDRIVFMPGYGSPFVTDINRGRRYASIDDFQNFVKLAYLSPWLHHSGGVVCEPVELPVNKRHLDMTYAQLRLSTKPFMGSVTAPERAADSINMARIVFGDEYLETYAVMQGNINANSPLVFDQTMTRALRTYAQANQCVAVSPAIFGGAMGPVSPAAIAAQTLAEGMAGIALAQLVRPGCPCVFGSFHSTMNLKTGSLSFGTPEANLVTMALSQLGRRLGVPVRSGGGQVTAANAADGQAMQDSANAMWATVLSGAHQVWHAAGWLEGGLTMSYEKFVLDLDNCGALLRLLEGMEVSDEAFAQASYFEAGPGENFLSTEHTLEHFEFANYESVLPDTGPFENWEAAGSPSADVRANRVWQSMLAAYESPQMDQSIDTRLKAYIDSRKTEMKDEWY